MPDCLKKWSGIFLLGEKTIRQIEASKKWRFIDIAEMMAYWEVLKSLIVRDIKLKYTQTLLGIGWVILQPLVTVGLFAIIFGKWMHLDAEGAPYVLFAFCGLIPWTFVYQGIQRSAQGIQNDKVIINKIYFPRLLIPLSVIAVTLIDSGILTIILGVLLKFFSIGFEWKMLCFPICLLPLFCLTLGLGSFFASLSVRYRDLIYLLPFFLQVFMYLSPVFYSSRAAFGQWFWLYRLNPMVGIIDACRWCFLKIESFPMENFAIASAISLAICLCGMSIFSYLDRYFADWL